MPFRDKFLLSAILLFIATLFFPFIQAASLLITAVLVVAAFTYNPFREKVQLFKQRPYIWWMLVFFVLIFFSAIFSDNTNRGFRYLDSRLPLLYFPLSIGLIHLQKRFRSQLLLGIGIVITLVAFICLVYGVYRALTFNEPSFLYNDSLSEPITGQQSIYISLLVNIAIYIFGWFIIYKRIRYKGLLVFGTVILFVTSFLLASRNMMLVLYVSVIIFGLWYSFSRKQYLEGATLIMGLLIGGFLVIKFFPKTLNRFKELTYTQFNYQQDGPESHYDVAVDTGQWNGANTRLAVWRCGWQLFQQAPLFGTGLGDKKDRLMQIYRERNFQFAIRTEKNLHSNYFDILVSMGIIGLLVFFIAWIVLPFRLAWQHKDGLAFLIMLTLAFAMITENYFDRGLGGMLVGFFIPFLLSDKKSKNL